MASDPRAQTEILHSENHSRLSSEEIAKAVARHNKNHSPQDAGKSAEKPKKAVKK